MAIRLPEYVSRIADVCAGTKFLILYIVGWENENSFVGPNRAWVYFPSLSTLRLRFDSAVGMLQGIGRSSKVGGFLSVLWFPQSR